MSKESKLPFLAFALHDPLILEFLDFTNTWPCRFDPYDNATLNNALRAAGLFSLLKLSDENRITLDTEIASGGGSLSVGQRQIMRQSRLLTLGAS